VSYLIDSDTCSAFLRADRRVSGKFLQYMGRLHISAVTAGELLAWAARANAPVARAVGIANLLKDVTVLDLTLEVARTFGVLRAEQLDQGRPAPALDLLIAATAMHHDLTLVTHNIRDYANVPGLAIEDWLV